jgi:two-component system CitB family sensor kinase
MELVLDPATELDAGVLEAAGVPVRDLVTVLGNLIDNAIDAVASVPPGRDSVRRIGVCIRRDGDELVVRVADSGPGLDPAMAQRAFERGWSTKDPGSRLHGRGLGLALVGQTVHRLGGTTQVAHDGGAVFTVRLPVAERVR